MNHTVAVIYTPGKQLQVELLHTSKYIELLCSMIRVSRRGLLNDLYDTLCTRSSITSQLESRSEVMGMWRLINVIVTALYTEMERRREYGSVTTKDDYISFWKAIDESLGSDFISALVRSSSLCNDYVMLDTAREVMSSSTTPKFSHWPVLSRWTY